MYRGIGSLLTLTLTVFVVALEPLPAAGQTGAESEIKAAFLSNFVRFIEWPPETLGASGPMTVCVRGSQAVTDSLKKAVKGRGVEGHEVVVIAASADDLLRACQVLYVAGSDEKSAKRALQAVDGAAVFTIGDFDRFATLGGVANFFLDDDRVRFAVNQAAARRQHLRLSAKMLTLAKLVNE